MIRREGVFAALGAVVLLGTLGGAVATAAVASSTTEGERAARATPQPSPAYHELADPDPSASPAGVRVRRTQPGDHPVTSGELRAHFLATDSEGQNPSDPDGAIWIAQSVITSRCMAQHGFHYDPRVVTDPPGFAGSDADRALNGDPDNQGADYDWRRAGCVGLAVHETGQDHAH